MTDYNAALALNAAVHEHATLVRSAGYEMSDIADAAATMGMDRVAKSLSIIVKALDESSDALIFAHSQAVHENLVSSEQATMNMMRGVLAGITIGSKEATK